MLNVILLFFTFSFSSPGTRDKVLKLRGAYQKNQTLNEEEHKKLRFFINRDLETELGVAVSFNLNLPLHVLQCTL